MIPWKDPKYHLVQTEEELQSLCKILDESEIISIDVETTGAYPSSGLNPYLAWLLGISVCVNKKEGYYIPIGHKVGAPCLPFDRIKKSLCPIFKKDKLFLAHNAKFDYKFLWQAGIHLHPKFWDTFIAIGLINGDSIKSRALKKIVKNYIDIPPALIQSFSDIVQDETASNLDPTQIYKYAINDVIFTYYLYEALKPTIDKEYYELFYNAEIPLIPILAQMELKGIRIDPEYLNNLKKPLIKYKEQIKTFFYKKYKASISSTQQVGKVFNNNFKQLALKTKPGTGNIITDVIALEEIKNRHPKKSEVHKVAKRVLKFREINKAITTYIEKLPKVCHVYYNSPAEHVLHTDFYQIKNSGRMSSTPNVQNIPRDGVISVRRGFIARDGYKLVEADWKSQEHKLFTSFCKEPEWINTYAQDPANADVHTVVAKKVFNKTKISDEERHTAKTINFAILYGGTEYTVSSILNCPLTDAKRLVDNFHQSFPYVSKWKDEETKKINKNGYATTLWGRKRFMPTIDEKWKYYKAIRQLINFVVQGSAADMLKFSMVKIVKEFAKQNLDAYLISTTHDSIMVECRDPEQVVPIIKRSMEVQVNKIFYSVDLEVKNSFAKK